MAMTVVHNIAAKVKVSMMGMTQQVCVNGDNGWAINPFEGKVNAEHLTADQIMEMKEYLRCPAKNSWVNPADF